MPRASHGDWEPALHRPDPVELLEEQAQTRVPELVPIRYGRMLVSPFTFYRGAAYLMASDLAAGPAPACTPSSAATRTFELRRLRRAGPQLVFGLNDFDETLPGPFEWDVKRLAASFAVAGRDRDFDEKRAPDQPEVGRSYRETIREFAAMRTLDLWYSRIDIDDLSRGCEPRLSQGRQGREAARGERRQGRTKDSLKAFSKLTDDRRRRAADHRRPAADRADRGRRTATRSSSWRILRS